MQVGEAGGEGGSLLEGARRGHQQAAAVAEHGFHRLDPAPFDLDVEVVALVGKGLALGVGGHGIRAHEGLQVRLGGDRPVRRRSEKHGHAIPRSAGESGQHSMSQ